MLMCCLAFSLCLRSQSVVHAEGYLCKSAIRLAHFLRYVVERLLGAVFSLCYYIPWLAQAGDRMDAQKRFTLMHIQKDLYA